MERLSYEAPKFDFQSLFLFEGVAETCWGYGHVSIRIYRDLDLNSQYNVPPDEEVLYQDFHYNGEPMENPGSTAHEGHCNDVAKLVFDAISGVPEEYQHYLEGISAGTNSKTFADIPIQEFPVS